MGVPFLESGMCDLEPGFPGFVYAITISDFLILFYVSLKGGHDFE